MKRSRFQKRKDDRKAHEVSALYRNMLSRADFQHLEEIGHAVLECEGLDDEQVGARYRLIGDLLHANVTLLDLDENIWQTTPRIALVRGR